MHHAYLYIGEISRDKILSDHKETSKIPKAGNPDLIERTYEILTIDDARELKAAAASRPIEKDGKKIFILRMDGMTVEAQNALLKLLEEPPSYAHFFLILPSAHLLLPTVRSRLSIIGEDRGRARSDLSEAESFLKAPPPKRLEIVKDLLDGISKERKTRKDAIDLLDGIEQAIYESQGAKDGRRSLEAVETARRYMNDRAPSLKMLLEFVALNV
ncbi:hypothetical protein KGP36_08025 [Patescibacteria group bacterium]|nr:hypothetical protein [Patescibacteria group bacterium]MDE1941393.1 hypothetical protein [Patescibacteria group bacterium]